MIKCVLHVLLLLTWLYLLAVSPFKVGVGYDEDQLITDRSTCHRLVHSHYPVSVHQASIREISKVLAIFSKESTNYVLLTVSLHFVFTVMGLPSRYHARKTAGILRPWCKSLLPWRAVSTFTTVPVPGQ